MITDINLQATRRYLENKYATQLIGGQDAIIPITFQFQNDVELANFVNATNQCCFGLLHIAYFSSAAPNFIEAQLFDLSSQISIAVVDQDIVGSVNYNAGPIEFSFMGYSVTSMSNAFTFTGWIFTLNL